MHPDRDIVEEYLRQLGTKLKIGGKGFIHHSNFGEYVNSPRGSASGGARETIDQGGPSRLGASSNPGMTAELFRMLSRAQSGLQCLSQELVNWRGETLDRLPFAVRAK